MILVAHGKETFQKSLAETIYHGIGRITAYDQSLGFFQFFGQLRKIIFNFADIVLGAAQTSDAGLDVDFGKFDKFIFQATGFKHGLDQPIRVAVLDRTSRNPDELWIHNSFL